MSSKAIVIALACCWLAGCSGGGGAGPQMAPVSGVVTLDGKPLVGADVFFVSGDFEGYGQTKEGGRYSLVRGAPVGKCLVYITQNPKDAASAGGIDTSIEGMDEEQMRAMGGGTETEVKGLLPAEYSDPEKSKLTFDVPAAGSEKADFNL